MGLEEIKLASTAEPELGTAQPQLVSSLFFHYSILRTKFENNDNTFNGILEIYNLK